MTRQGIANIVNAACRRAGIARVGPHALRHTAATEMLRGGATLTEVAQVLRHRRLLSTTTYAHADMSHKQRAIDRTKPLTARPGRYQPDDALLAFLENL